MKAREASCNSQQPKAVGVVTVGYGHITITSYEWHSSKTDTQKLEMLTKQNSMSENTACEADTLVNEHNQKKVRWNEQKAKTSHSK